METYQTNKRKTLVAASNGKQTAFVDDNSKLIGYEDEKEEYIVDTITENYLKDHINPKKKVICEGRKHVAGIILQSLSWIGISMKKTGYTSISNFKTCKI